MKKQRIWGLVAVVAGIAILVGGAATASNMGFKFVPNLPSGTGTNAFNLALPWNNNYIDAASLFDDLATYGGIDSVQKVAPDATLGGWFGPGSGTNNFTIVKGEAYVVFAASANFAPVNPVVVGSHDPNYTFTFPAGATNAAAPYHQTYVDAAGVFDAIAATCPSKLDSIQKFAPDATLGGWFGPGSGTNNFSLTLGEGVVVFTNAQCSGFVWAHY